MLQESRPLRDICCSIFTLPRTAPGQAARSNENPVLDTENAVKARTRVVVAGAGAGIGLVAVGVLLGLSMARGKGAPEEQAVSALATASGSGAPGVEGPFTPAIAAAILEPMFETLDCTEAGYFQEPEINEHFSQIFRFYDRDLSRTITRAEYLRGTSGAKKQELQHLFARIDADKNGILSAKEYREHLSAMFQLADANRDGELTREELTADRAR